MKKIIFFLTIASVFAIFTGFKWAPPATVIDTHYDLPIFETDLSPCNGESILLIGTTGVDIHGVIIGNKVNVSTHQNGHLDGVSDQGNTYIVNFNAHLTNNLSLTNGQASFIIIVNSNWISNGAAPNFLFSERQKIIVNANGVATVERLGSSIICRG